MVADKLTHAEGRSTAGGSAKKPTDACGQGDSATVNKRRRKKSAWRMRVNGDPESPPLPPGITCRIFSKEFVEHNQQREAEMRRKKIEVGKLEREKQLLQANIAAMRASVKAEEENVNRLRLQITTIRNALNMYQQAVLSAMNKIPRNKNDPVLTIQNLEKYLKLACDLNEANGGENAQFLATIREMMHNLRLPSVHIQI